MCEVMRAGVLCVLNSEQQQAGWSRSPAERELLDAWGCWFDPHSNMNAHMRACVPSPKGQRSHLRQRRSLRSEGAARSWGIVSSDPDEEGCSPVCTEQVVL